MASFETAVNGGLQIQFYLKGKRYREGLGVSDTKEHRRDFNPKRQAIEKAIGNYGMKEGGMTTLMELCPRNLQNFRDDGLLKDEEGQVLDLTVGDLLDKVQADYARNGRSNTKHLVSTLKPVYAHFKHRMVVELTTDMVDKFIDKQLQLGYSKSTINIRLAALIRGFTIATEAGIVAKAPVIKKLDASDNVRQGFFERDLLEAFLRRLPEVYADAVRFGEITGWRKSNVLAREWRHVAWDRGWVSLEPGEAKNKKAIRFPLIPELREILERRRARTDELQKQTGQIVRWVFHRDGERIMNFRKVWDRVCEEVAQERKEIGLPALEQKPLFHDLRRTAVLHLQAAGVDRAIQKKLVGHKTDAMIERYGIDNEALLLDAGAKLQAVREGADVLKSQTIAKLSEARAKKTGK